MLHNVKFNGEEYIYIFSLTKIFTCLLWVYTILFAIYKGLNKHYNCYICVLVYIEHYQL